MTIARKLQEHNTLQVSKDKELNDLKDYDHKNGKVWDKHKYFNEQAALQFTKSDDPRVKRWGERMIVCSDFIFFNQEISNDVMSLKLARAHFCHVRACPICQWRRSLVMKANVLNNLPKLIKEYPKARYVMLTLTVKNCGVNEVRETIKAMNAGFIRLKKTAVFQRGVMGFIKSVEVTRNKDNDTAHPHFHLVLQVPPSYFGERYISQKKWKELWRDCCRLDYSPSVYVSAVKAGQEFHMVQEALKYTVKESDMLDKHSCDEWYATLMTELHHMRLQSTGGTLKGLIKDDREPTDQELINAGQQESTVEGQMTISFRWQTRLRRYSRFGKLAKKTL